MSLLAATFTGGQLRDAVNARALMAMIPLNIDDYGADTDPAAAVLAAAGVAALTGRRITDTPGRVYNWTSAATFTDFPADIDLTNGQHFRAAAMSNTAAISVTHTFTGAPVSATTTATTYDFGQGTAADCVFVTTSLTVSVGDEVKLYSDDFIPSSDMDGGDGQNSNERCAEDLTVAALGSGGFYTYGPLRETTLLGSTNNLRIVKYRKLGCRVAINISDASDAPTTRNAPFVDITGAVNAQIKGRYTDGLSMGVRLTSCPFVRADIYAADLRTDDANNALGYGVYVLGGRDHYIKVVCERVRHGVTTGTYGVLANAATPERYGAPIGATFWVDATDCTNSPADAHSEALGTVFEFVRSRGSWRGPSANVPGALQLRGRRTRVGYADIEAIQALKVDVTQGITANAQITFASTPSNGHTIVINGVTFTFKTTVSDPAVDILIVAGNRSATLANAAAVLNASANSSVNVAAYGSSGTALSIRYKTSGTAGNAFTVSAGTSSGVATSSTLVGGRTLTEADIAGNFVIDTLIWRRREGVVSGLSAFDLGASSLSSIAAAKCYLTIKNLHVEGYIPASLFFLNRINLQIDNMSGRIVHDGGATQLFYSLGASRVTINNWRLKLVRKPGGVTGSIRLFRAEDGSQIMRCKSLSLETDTGAWYFADGGSANSTFIFDDVDTDALPTTGWVSMGAAAKYWANLRLHGVPVRAASEARLNASATVVAFKAGAVQMLDVAITAARTTIIDTAALMPGAEIDCVRTANATGAFNWNISDGSTTVVALTAAGQWARVKWTGSALVLVAKGSLS